MILITWFSCLAVLWMKAVDTRENTVPPLVIAVYFEGESKRITLTDSTAVGVNELKWPLNEIKPTFIALLCKDGNKYSEEYMFKLKQVTNTIDSIDLQRKCRYHSQPYVKEKVEDSLPFYYIGIKLTKHKSSGDVLTMFQERLKISEDAYSSVPYLKIKYNFEFMIPESLTYRVIAHMHSDESVEECETIKVRREAMRPQNSYDDLVRKFDLNRAQSDFQWRQLAPIGDFKGIYTTNATCIHINYILLREKAFESLKSIEIFTRKVADVINEVSVVSGTYINKNDDSVQIRDENGNAIPTIVWRKISFKSDHKYYDVLVVIHNQETERFCDKVDGWGWPEHNREEKIGSNTENSNEKLAIGTMYYCSMNSEMSNKLGIKDTKHSPFSLYEVQYNNKKIDFSQIIKTSESSKKN